MPARYTERQAAGRSEVARYYQGPGVSVTGSCMQRGFKSSRWTYMYRIANFPVGGTHITPTGWSSDAASSPKSFRPTGLEPLLSPFCAQKDNTGQGCSILPHSITKAAFRLPYTWPLGEVAAMSHGLHHNIKCRYEGFFD